jgi:hypothetical protein
MTTTTEIPIIPHEISIINQIGKFTLTLTNFVLSTSVDLIVSLYDTENKFISTILMKLEGDDYLNWGNNDDYLITYICTKLDFELQPIETF